jgi:hypothetical protein
MLDTNALKDDADRRKEEKMQRKWKMKETIATAIMSIARIAG